MVCGYNQLPGPLYNGEDIPDVSLICPCCGFQPGYDDDDLGDSIESYRIKWIESGAKWFTEKMKPQKWELHEQLKNIGGSM